jgi:hypothetical protein
MRVMEANRLAACADVAVRAGIERHIAWLGAEAADADRRLGEAVRVSPAGREGTRGCGRSRLDVVPHRGQPRTRLFSGTRNRAPPGRQAGASLDSVGQPCAAGSVLRVRSDRPPGRHKSRIRPLTRNTIAHLRLIVSGL